MKIDVLTLFPAMFAGPLDESIIKRARQKGILDLKIHDLRDWTHDRHRTVDDRPFGGGPGMLLKGHREGVGNCPAWAQVEMGLAQACGTRLPSGQKLLTGQGMALADEPGK